ncbi:MAG TPA: hypothetical protein VJ184_00140 [Chryseolinea sp.]|nr:hypothetical protein [Chryseolinea sp.]
MQFVFLIGGVAVIYHGYTRSTADLDFWYNPTVTNFHKIINALKEYGIDVADLEKVVFDPKKLSYDFLLLLSKRNFCLQFQAIFLSNW